jgi:hypothetical protein
LKERNGVLWVHIIAVSQQCAGRTKEIDIALLSAAARIFGANCGML